MRVLVLFTSLTLPLLSANALAAPVDPSSCPCDFEAAYIDGMLGLETTDCQNSDATELIRERGQRGAFTETLSFAGGIGQACPDMQVAKTRRGNDSVFSCTIRVMESRSSDQADCMVIRPRNVPVQTYTISHKRMRACQRLLDEVADLAFALPDCSAP